MTAVRRYLRTLALGDMDRQVDQLARIVEVIAERHYHGLPLPPEELRLHVGANVAAANYLGQGINSSQRVLEIFGEEPSRPVLDWGCGTGRTLRWLRHYPAWQEQYRGCDVDDCAVSWLREHRVPNVDVCADRPPLPYPTGIFGGLFGFSILTHIHPTLHRAWLQELRRIMRDDGTAYITFHGTAVLDSPKFSLPPAVKHAYETQGFAYLQQQGHYKDAAFVNPTYTEHNLAGLFQVLAYEPSGYQNQDAFLLRAM